MIFDCFLFFKEFDVLDLRLNILNEAVDFFVLAEANITFSGQRKPFYFEQQKDQFKAFLPKIIHVKIEDDPPVVTSAWDREFWQRDAIARGLKDAQPTDYVMYSDVDEIPNPEGIRYAVANDLNDMIFYQRCYYYYLNLYGRMWRGSVITKWQGGQRMQMVRKKRVSKKKYYIYKNGGWHFSWLGNAEQAKEKLEAFSHQELNTKAIKSQLGRFLKHFQLPWEKRSTLRKVLIDDSYPSYIRDNQKQLITRGFLLK